MYEFFNQGWNTYLQGHDINNCPYIESSLEGIDWLEGYRLSQLEDIGEQDEE